MTIPVQIPVNEFIASGSNDTFAFTFRILSNNDLVVLINDIIQTESTDYDIVGLTDAGGDVVFIVIPAANELIRLTRSTSVDQDVVYTPFDSFPAKTHEGALDKITMILQELREVVSEVTTGGDVFSSINETWVDIFVTNVTNFNAESINNLTILNQSIGSVAGVVTIDYKLGMGVTLTLTEDVTSIVFSNIPATGLAQLELDIRQDSTPRTIAWPALILWPGGVEPDISAADSITQVHLRSTDGGVEWLGSYVENTS